VIESGESFSFVENLYNYSKIENAGDYVVQALIHPSLSENEKIASNRLALRIKNKPVTDEYGVPEALDIASGADEERQKLAPDEVVNWTISARQRSQWEKFFLYLDLEKMLTRDSAKQRRWRAESEEGRLNMLADYRRELQKSMIDGDIAAIPYEFTIQNTNYNLTEGTVKVLEKFKAGGSEKGYTEIKLYTYYIEKTDGCWVIVDYVVENLGTE